MRCFVAYLLRYGLPALMLVVMGDSGAWAAPNSEQRDQISRAKLAARAAERLFESGRATEAVEQIEKAHAEIAELKASEPDAETQKLLEPVLQQLGGLYLLLELEGLPIPAMPEPPAKEAPAEAMTAEQATLGTPPPQPANGQAVSFSKVIAPLLVSKCGRCHIDDSKGKISVATYAALMAGSPDDGPIVLPGKGNGSRIFEVIESGDMPRGGGRISSEQLALLTRWIDEGAKNDAPAANTPLRQLAGAAAAPVEVKAATGKETVSFGLHIAPVLVAQCSECHGAERPRAEFSVDTFRRLLRGGDSGPVLVPGKPAESLLVKMIKGMAGARMPLRRAPLDAETIARIETWIREGATFDGDSQDDTLRRVAAVLLARNSTPEQLSEQRAKLAEQTWRLAIPDAPPARLETKNFLLMGNVGPSTLQEIAEVAEAQAAKIGSVLPQANGATVSKGRVTIFVFAQRFDYSEFGTMVERRQIPSGWTAHWRYDIVEPYIALHDVRDARDSLDTVLAHQILSTYVATHGEGAAPRWFSDGAGRALAAQLDAKDPLVARWEEQLPSVLAQMKKPDDFLQGKLAPEDNDLAGYSFMQFLLTSSSRFSQVLGALDKGAEFEPALQQAYGRPAAQLAPVWGAWLSSRR